MRAAFKNTDSEAVLTIDAKNAFNSLKAKLRPQQIIQEKKEKNFGIK